MHPVVVKVNIKLMLSSSFFFWYVARVEIQHECPVSLLLLNAMDLVP